MTVRIIWVKLQLTHSVRYALSAFTVEGLEFVKGCLALKTPN